MPRLSSAEWASLTKLSATSLKLYLECPHCFWLAMKKKIERPRGPFPSLPSGMDLVLKRYFDGYRRAGSLPPLIDGKLEGTLMKDALTIGFTDPATNARLWGKLDDGVILPGGRYAPLDHKTRASAPADESYTTKYYKFQMDVYTLLLERNGYPITRTAYVVYYYPLDGVLHQGFPFGVTLHHIATDPEHALTVFQSALNALDGPLPSPAPTCAFCAWTITRQAAIDA